MDEKKIIELIRFKIDFFKDFAEKTNNLESRTIAYAKIETLQALLYEIEKGS